MKSNTHRNIRCSRLDTIQIINLTEINDTHQKLREHLQTLHQAKNHHTLKLQLEEFIENGLVLYCSFLQGLQ